MFSQSTEYGIEFKVMETRLQRASNFGVLHLNTLNQTSSCCSCSISTHPTIQAARIPPPVRLFVSSVQ